jgi:hypothetical protein
MDTQSFFFNKCSYEQVYSLKVFRVLKKLILTFFFVSVLIAVEQKLFRVPYLPFLLTSPLLIFFMQLLILETVEYMLSLPHLSVSFIFISGWHFSAWMVNCFSVGTYLQCT